LHHLYSGSHPSETQVSISRSNILNPRVISVIKIIELGEKVIESKNNMSPRNLSAFEAGVIDGLRSSKLIKIRIKMSPDKVHNTYRQWKHGV
jgi:hypothetical protein